VKIAVIQPPYGAKKEEADRFFDFKLDCLQECDETCDLIVLPEYSEVPWTAPTREETLEAHGRYAERLTEACRNTAKRCCAMVFYNMLTMVEGRWRNTTLALNREGEIVGRYYKTHIPPAEKAIGVAYDYTQEPVEPQILEAEGIRFGFMTCYDFYFYEAYAALARRKPDIIIGCSLQRSDTHKASETFCRFLAYNTNAYVIRSSVSIDENSEIGGGSMAVAPDSTVLMNMESRFGVEYFEMDPHKKYEKPAGFGRNPAPHYAYIEEGRNRWQYRPAGPAMVLPDCLMPYPRVCAHRGFSTIAPENSMPAFGAAVALGAEEIEFDIWATTDGELVSLHDPTLERTSDGKGNIWEHSYKELSKLDFGSKTAKAFKGLKIVRFEDILKKFAGQVIMNIHVKIWDAEFEKDYLEEIVTLIRKYDCTDTVYFMTTSDRMLKKAKEKAPDIAICVGHDESRPYAIVDRAIELGAQKVQLFRPYFNREMVKKAHEHQIICNVFWSDEEERTKEYLDMGIDTILSNDYWATAQVVKAYKKK